MGTEVGSIYSFICKMYPYKKGKLENNMDIECYVKWRKRSVMLHKPRNSKLSTKCQKLAKKHEIRLLLDT